MAAPVTNIQIDSNVKTEKQAVASISDFIKNPPKNPVDMVRFVAKNFSVSGDVAGAIGKLLPSVGKLLPIAGAIFDVFSSLSAPSIGDQIAAAVSEITNAIQAGVEEVKNALAFSTEKTISAVLTEVQTISMEESAARVMQAMTESEILADADAQKKQIFDTYTQKVGELNQQWQDEIISSLNEAQARVDQLYSQIQDYLATLGIDLMQQLVDLYNAATKVEEPAPAAVSRSIPVLTTAAPQQSEEIGISPILIGGVSLAILALWLSRKKN